ncbi:IclR family transcriptional regulator [Janibacter anophelis]|uniref:IclR family transcriptional regulator n=1 Tax=Janibacter anophelis TaxID=319054 RepID=UPI00082C18A9|nr:IclR family transcriptional regulator [Janibacter anophelis]
MSLGLERVARILDLFTSDVPEWTVTDVCRALDLPKSTVWESLQDMTEVGLLRRVGRGRYRLGWRAFQIGLRARMTSEISGPAWETMRRLVETHHETMHLVSRYRSHVVFLEKIAPPTGVRVNLARVGERLPAHCTASGKVLLAALSRSELVDLYGTGLPSGLTRRSITDLNSLRDELARVAGRGYALDVEEYVDGVCSLAAPITNRHGDTAWALSMSFPVARLESHGDGYARAVVEAAQHLSNVA